MIDTSTKNNSYTQGYTANGMTAVVVGGVGLRKKLLFISACFVAAISGIMLYTVATIANQHSDGAIIDLAGRQRMLAQRYMKEVLLTAGGVEADYAATIQLFDNTLESLLDGGPAVRRPKTGQTTILPQATLPEADASLRSQRRLSQELKNLTARYLALNPNNAEYKRATSKLIKVNAQLQLEADSLARAFADQFEDEILAMIRWEISVAILAAILGLGATWITARGIGKPLQAVVERAKEIAEGRLDMRDMTVLARDEVGQLARSFNTMVSSLRGMVIETQMVTENLNSSAAEILATSHKQVNNTKQQTVIIQQISLAVEEISQSGQQAADRAHQVAQGVNATAATGAMGLQAVETITKAMDGIRQQANMVAENVVMLSEKTHAIGEIIATVNDIAEQSNLVALNAAIEAADTRGEGHRFSVVAGEIKNLADQAKEATRQVRTILEEIQKGINMTVMVTEEAVKRVEFGREKVEVAEETMRNMANSIQESASAFQQIVGATNQQRIGFEQVVNALSEIRLASLQTAISTDQVSSAADSLNTLGQQLRNVVDRFQT